MTGVQTCALPIWQLNDDAMASDLLADGIRRFAKDQQALETLLIDEGVI